MTYVTEQTPQELRAHMKRLQAMPGWHNPLDDRLYAEILALDAEITQLRASAAQTSPEPVAWRSRYRSEPGMIGHYPWTYTDGARRRVADRPEYESEPLYTHPPPPIPEPASTGGALTDDVQRDLHAVLKDAVERGLIDESTAREIKAALPSDTGEAGS